MVPASGSRSSLLTPRLSSELEPGEGGRSRTGRMAGTAAGFLLAHAGVSATLSLRLLIVTRFPRASPRLLNPSRDSLTTYCIVRFLG